MYSPEKKWLNDENTYKKQLYLDPNIQQEAHGPLVKIYFVICKSSNMLILLIYPYIIKNILMRCVI